ncbi:MAG: 3-hydroxyacyl-CoA dehydrogenase NAD-binding domain-containing protein [Thermodesulfobacteriota bacterium]
MIAITETVTLEIGNQIALLAIDNPPVNALGITVRQGIAEGIRRAGMDGRVKAIMLVCRGRTFFAGADIRELGRPPLEPMLPQVLEAIEVCPKPVIAVIHGTAFGGGLETALTCDYRVAAPSAKLGLPEVKLGVLPGAGGTQRLPRLVGPEKALEMIVSGNPVSAGEALRIGLVDRIIAGDLLQGAVAFTETVIADGQPLRKVSGMNQKVEADRGRPEIFADFRKSIARTARGFEAPEACIQAVEAAVNRPFAEGLAVERELFRKLVSGSQSAAQRYHFFAERQVGKLPDIPNDTPLLDIRKAAVIGAGTMGGGIAMNFVNAGIPVTLVEAKAEFLERGLGVIRKNYEITASKGKMARTEVDKRMSLITGTVSLEAAAGADIVIEAVFENMELKKDIFRRLDASCKPEAILATNTSYLDVNEIAAVTGRPEKVLGLHFFSPANVMRLLEIVRAEKTSKTVLATCLGLAATIRKIAVVVGVCHGFAGNRMFAQREREVQKLILEGALPGQVDRVMYDFGFPMGPLALRDLIGLDLGWSRETSTGSTIREALCEMGRLGLKAGAGFYRYETGNRTPIRDPEVEQLIMDFSKKQNIRRREISDEEIRQRCIYPIINEGAKILAEKIAVRPGDLDVIWVNGYGWPVYRGGPMFYADLVGLDTIRDALKKFQQEFGDEWQPAALIEELVRTGKGFRDLDEKQAIERRQ